MHGILLGRPTWWSCIITLLVKEALLCCLLGYKEHIHMAAAAR